MRAWRFQSALRLPSDVKNSRNRGKTQPDNVELGDRCDLTWTSGHGLNLPTFVHGICTQFFTQTCIKMHFLAIGQESNPLRPLKIKGPRGWGRIFVISRLGVQVPPGAPVNHGSQAIGCDPTSFLLHVCYACCSNVCLLFCRLLTWNGKVKPILVVFRFLGKRRCGGESPSFCLRDDGRYA